MQTVNRFIPSNGRRYNTFSNGNGEVRLMTEAEQVTILRLLILLAQELGRLEQLLTGENGAASSVINHALQLLRQLERPTQEEINQ